MRPHGCRPPMVRDAAHEVAETGLDPKIAAPHHEAERDRMCAKKKAPAVGPGPNQWTCDRDSSAALRPDRTLLGSAHDLTHALVVELLNAFSFECLGRVDVALGIDRDAMDAIELAGLASA